MPNPYTPFTPAINNFFGREYILAALCHRLEPDSEDYRLARHFLLVGDGGIGKTSLLKRMKREIQQGRRAVCTIDIDIGDYSFDLAGLIEDLNSQIPRAGRLSSRAKIGLGLSPRVSKREVFNRLVQGFRDSIAIGFPPTIQMTPGVFFQDVRHGEGLARKLASWCGDLLQLSAESSGAIAILIDQMGKLLEMPGGLLVAQSLAELMTEAVEHHLSNILLVMAIRPEQKGTLEHCFRQEIFHPRYVIRIPLYPLGWEAARKAISEPARGEGVFLETGFVEEMLKHCGDHPYFLQIACYRLWEHLADKGLLYQIPIKLSESEVEQVIREGQSAMFRDFSPEEQYLLKVLALSWSVPLTRMQLKEKIEEIGHMHIVSVDSVLTELIGHKHRPIKYHEATKAYSLAHDLFAEYILRNECSQEQREVAVLQSVLDNAPRVYEITGALLTEAQLELIWSCRDRLTWKKECIPVVIVSEAKSVGFAGRWAEWFLSSAESTARLAAAKVIDGKVSARVWKLLSKLQDDSNEDVCRASQEALSRSSTSWTWDDEWQFEPSTI
jgi:hypothetical protein